MKVGVVIVAAGQGERLAAGMPKCILSIRNIPLVLLATLPFQVCDGVNSIVLVVPYEYVKFINNKVKAFRMDKVFMVVAGGVKRQDSVENGVKNLPKEEKYVLIHDGARVFIDEQSIYKVISELANHPVVTLASSVSDTLHKYDRDLCFAGPSRDTLIAAQTPQGFERILLEQALTKAKNSDKYMTDEVSLVRELCEVAAYPVFGETPNVKITYPEDLEFYKPQLLSLARKVRNFKAQSRNI